MSANVNLNVVRDGKAVVFMDSNGKQLLKVHMSTEKAAQKKVDLILESSAAAASPSNEVMS